MEKERRKTTDKRETGATEPEVYGKFPYCRALFLSFVYSIEASIL